MTYTTVPAGLFRAITTVGDVGDPNDSPFGEILKRAGDAKDEGYSTMTAALPKEGLTLVLGHKKPEEDAIFIGGWFDDQVPQTIRPEYFVASSHATRILAAGIERRKAILEFRADRHATEVILPLMGVMFAAIVGAVYTVRQGMELPSPTVVACAAVAIVTALVLVANARKRARHQTLVAEDLVLGQMNEELGKRG